MRVRAMTACTEGAKLQLRSFLTSEIDGGELLDPNPGRLPPAANEEEDEWASEPISTLWRTEKSTAPAGNRTPVRPARSLITAPNTTMTSVKACACDYQRVTSL